MAVEAMPMSRISSIIVTLCAIMLMSVVLPEQALAWGPGAHMVMGNWILQNLATLPAVVAAVLMRHPGAYLHGSLSADIFIGKGSQARKGHSHNWESGFSLLEAADTTQKQAYAYGYLSHLAADVVAHNVFVPGLVHTAPGSGKMAHVYLEAQADRLLAWDSGDAVSVFHRKNSSGADAMLRSTMRQRALPFWLKKHLYEGSVALGGSGLWRGSMRLIDGLVVQSDRRALLDYMLILSTRAVFDMLKQGKESPLLNLDPIGADALSRACATHRRKGLISRNIRNRLKAAMNLTATGGCGPDTVPALAVSVPPILESFPPLCTSDGMRR